jgi:ribosomal protein L31
LRKQRWPWALAAAAVLVVALAVLLWGDRFGIAELPSTEPESTSWYIDVLRYNQGVHGGLDCSVCHTYIDLDQHPDAENLQANATEVFQYDACSNCHPQEYADYQQGVHAEILSGARDTDSEYPAPTCGHCHDPHYRQVLSRLEVIDAQVHICGQCHPSELETYLGDYHGKTAVNLDFEESASCADCHGSHRVLALDQPEKEIEACRRCHPTADVAMAGYLVHAEEAPSPTPDQEHSQEFRILFFVQLFFVTLTIGVLAFFYGHTILWLLRSLHERLRRP